MRALARPHARDDVVEKFGIERVRREGESRGGTARDVRPYAAWSHKCDVHAERGTFHREDLCDGVRGCL